MIRTLSARFAATLLAIVSLSCVAMSGAQAQTEPQTQTAQRKIGVFNIKVIGYDQNLAAAGLDAIATEVTRLNLGAVVSTQDLEALLDAQKRADTIGCNEMNCLVEVGSLAGVTELVATSITKVGESMVVSQQPIDVGTSSVRDRVTLSWPGPIESFTELLGASVEQLMLGAETERKGTVLLAGGPIGTRWRLDDKAVSGDSAKVSAGVHTVHIEAIGYDSLDKVVVVRVDRSTVIDASLKAVEVNNKSGIGVNLGVFLPMGRDYASKKAGISFGAIYWLEFDAMAIHPQFNMKFDFEEEDRPNYVEMSLDAGASWLILRTEVTPLVGFGFGARWLKTDRPRQTPETTSGFGFGGYLRIGALLFRSSDARLNINLDYSLTYINSETVPHGLQLTASFVI